eukprot:TRINITY_DN33819_c0_g1_i1.p1 TRINITY_DN33819_c0_g1~~TRINITY_DN33819_c0_g1_i1.p1  ORF type:complete len:443 (-),score=138.02 TRINITY_DN33819_c0_g1_i1:403-1731(-)
MSKSVRELKEELEARGIDYSHCCEKSELEALLSSEAEAAVSTSAGSGEEAAASPPCHLEDGGYAAEREGHHRKAWVEFVTDGEALCHWDDGTSGIVPAADLDFVPQEALPCPVSFDGAFEDARAAAFADGRLLVVSLEGARTGCTAAEKVQKIHALVLASDSVVGLVSENALFWRGHVDTLRPPHVPQLAPDGAPSLALVLPLASDAMRVLNTFSDAVSVEMAVQAFISGLEALDAHRAAADARMCSEEAQLRWEQEAEFAAALAADQAKEAERQSLLAAGGDVDDATMAAIAEAEAADAEMRAAEVAAAAAAEAEAAAMAAAEAQEAEQLTKRRRLLADDFLGSAEVPDGAKPAKLRLTLPSGDRIERTFAAEDRLYRVRAWAECCEHLPEANSRSLSIPPKFMLATSFPRRKLSHEDDERTLAELGLVPNAALLLLDEST